MIHTLPSLVAISKVRTAFASRAFMIKDFSCVKVSDYLKPTIAGYHSQPVDNLLASFD